MFYVGSLFASCDLLQQATRKSVKIGELRLDQGQQRESWVPALALAPLTPTADVWSNRFFQVTLSNTALPDTFTYMALP